MADLKVELYGMSIGTLGGDWRNFDFVPDLEAVTIFGLDSPVLSVALPLAVQPPRAQKRRRQNFFRELLPEGRMLNWLAREAGVPVADVIGLLRRFGRDVAGALQIRDPEAPGEPRSPRTERVSSGEIVTLLQNIQAFPLGNRPTGGKSSLAGVQDKIVLVRTEAGWAQALDGFPSTHILQPASSDYPTLIYDEEYGARLARAVGLAGFTTWIDEFDGMPALVIERYDRAVDLPEGRLHQEDFNQALGASSDEKYQRFGGKVSLGRIAALLREFGESGDQERLLRMVTMAVATGNLDMHTKNLSLLHRPDGTIRLAPAYDLVPQVHQPNDGELALAIAGEYRHAAVTRAHLTAEAESWGLQAADEIIDSLLEATLEFIAVEQPHELAYSGLRTDIGRFGRNLLAGRPAGHG